jgi:hypothetical protein
MKESLPDDVAADPFAAATQAAKADAGNAGAALGIVLKDISYQVYQDGNSALVSKTLRRSMKASIDRLLVLRARVLQHSGYIERVAEDNFVLQAKQLKLSQDVAQLDSDIALTDTENTRLQLELEAIDNQVSVARRQLSLCLELACSLRTESHASES